MKKILFSMLAAVFLLTFSTFAYAWHLEYSYTNSGVMMVDGGSNYLSLNASDGGTAGTGWEVQYAAENSDGSISVGYDVYPASGAYWGFSDASILFQIVSDYDNMDNVLIDTTVSGDAFADVGVDIDGHYDGLVANSKIDAVLTNNYGGSGLYIGALADEMLQYDSDNDSFNDNLQLAANTWYDIYAILEVDVWSDLMGLPPDTFPSWGNYNDFFGGVYYGHIEAFTLYSELCYDLSIDTTEAPAVPVPATMLLLGTGLLGLAGFRKKFRKA